MSDQHPTKMTLTSQNPAEVRRKALMELFPEAFSEGKLDLDTLRQALGEDIAVGRERYGLSWAGKSEAVRAVQIPSVGTLIPDRSESVDFDATENMFIEGDNLEVLKLLQKSYYGKIKMIYIDPPYNTGNDFIYPDNFREGLHDYLLYSGQIDAKGNPQTTLSDRNGRFHSRWLNMLYPRLFLAKALLREDGLIFISIDDNEVHNLRALLNEIFGEENFIAELSWKNVYGGGAKSKHIVPQHEYVLCYARNSANIESIDLPPDPELKKRYTEKDNKYNIRGPYFTQPLSTTSMDYRPNLRYPIPYNGIEIWPEKQWQWSKERVIEALNNDALVIKETNEGWSVRYKQYLKDEDGNERPAKLFSVIVKPWSQEGTSEIVDLLGSGKIFPFPKPSSLIARFVSACWRDNDSIVLDFFSGSCSTAQAVLELNHQLATHFKFIMVQLPEIVPDSSEAFDAGFKTIADIGKERIRRVINKIRAGNDEELHFGQHNNSEDLGFRVFKLAASNFKIWQADDVPADAYRLGEQLKMFADHVIQGKPEEAVLYELILKSGLPLTSKIEEKSAEGRKVYLVDEEGASLAICLEKQITLESLRAIIQFSPKRLICIDNAFEGNDQLKTNTVLEMKSHQIEFLTV